MKRNIIMSFIVLCLFSIILIGCGKKGYRSIKVFKTEGTVNVIRGKKTTEASVDMKLKNNDVVEVSSSSSTVLKLDNDKFVMAKENTTLRLVASGKANNTKTRILVDKGGVIVEVKEKLKEKESFEIASSNSVMAIRGTQISFDVEVKDNKITTSFAILEGNTEILLLKNDKLSSTTLSKDFRMSYTTDLSEVKTVKDIAKLVDKTKPSKIEEVSDNDLVTVFNAIKEELTTEEIDSIVDTINEFERDETKDKVNGTIKFKFDSNPTYLSDPKDFITIEEDWKDLVGLQYLYSKTIDGEYAEYNSDNPLELGTWYCKIKAGNAYRSEPLEFSVIQTEIKLNAMSAQIDYMEDPKNYITLKNAPENVVYKYSKTIDGEYKEFDSNNPLELGTWYVTIDAGLAYTFTPVSFEVTKIELYSPTILSSIYYDGNAYMRADITNEKLVEFFGSELAQTPADEPNSQSDYMYYIIVWYGDPDDSDGYKYPIYFDYENFGGFGTANQGGEEVEIYIDYNLPDYFDYKGQTDYMYSLEDYLDVKYVYATSDGSGITTINANIEYFSTEYSDVKLVCMDGDLEMEPISFEINNGIGSADISITQGSFYFKIDGTDIKSETYSFDASNFTDGTGSSMSMDNPSNTIITYNEDDTINIYLDLGFNGANTYEYLLVNSYNDVLVGGATSLLRNHISTGNTSYLVMENVKDTSYTPNFIGIVRIVDGLAYVASDRTGGQSGIINESTRYYGYINAADDAYYAESYQYFIKGTNIDFYDANGNYIISVAESDFQYEGNDYMFTTSLLDYEAADVSLYFTATVYGYIPQVINEELINDDGTFSDEVFAYVSNMLNENGVTIKGSNKHYVVMAKFN